MMIPAFFAFPFPFYLLPFSPLLLCFDVDFANFLDFGGWHGSHEIKWHDVTIVVDYGTFPTRLDG